MNLIPLNGGNEAVNNCFCKTICDIGRFLQSLILRIKDFILKFFRDKQYPIPQIPAPPPLAQLRAPSIQKALELTTLMNSLNSLNNKDLFSAFNQYLSASDKKNVYLEIEKKCKPVLCESLGEWLSLVEIAREDFAWRYDTRDLYKESKHELLKTYAVKHLSEYNENPPRLSRITEGFLPQDPEWFALRGWKQAMVNKRENPNHAARNQEFQQYVDNSKNELFQLFGKDYAWKDLFKTKQIIGYNNLNKIPDESIKSPYFKTVLRLGQEVLPILDKQKLNGIEIYRTNAMLSDAFGLAFPKDPEWFARRGQQLGKEFIKADVIEKGNEAYAEMKPNRENVGKELMETNPEDFGEEIKRALRQALERKIKWYEAQ